MRCTAMPRVLPAALRGPLGRSQCSKYEKRADQLTYARQTCAFCMIRSPSSYSTGPLRRSSHSARSFGPHSALFGAAAMVLQFWDSENRDKGPWWVSQVPPWRVKTSSDCSSGSRLTNKHTISLLVYVTSAATSDHRNTPNQRRGTDM